MSSLDSGAAAAIAVVREQVEVSVRAADDVTKAAVGSVEQALLGDDPACVSRESREVCAAQRSDEEIVGELRYPLTAIERDPGGRDRRRIEDDRRHHARSRRGALNHWPAIVRSRLNDVDLVVAARSVLGFPEIAGDRVPVDALRIAVTVGEHGRTESVPRRRRASRRDTKNFSSERRDVLREVRVRGIASGRIQKAVRPELQSAAVVDR